MSDVVKRKADWLDWFYCFWQGHVWHDPDEAAKARGITRCCTRCLVELKD